jgi:beta-galactosidase
VTVGPAVALRLTPILGPLGFFAEGADIAMFDVEVVDAEGRRVVTDEARVDFTYSGEGQFLGGYNSGILLSTYNDYLNTEGGINRVFVRSTRTAGDFTLTVTRDGLEPATVTITSQPFPVDANGLSLSFSQRYSPGLPAEEPPAVPDPG